MRGSRSCTAWHSASKRVDGRWAVDVKAEMVVAADDHRLIVFRDVEELAAFDVAGQEHVGRGRKPRCC